MEKKIIYLNDEFKDIDFENTSLDELISNGFKQSVPVSYKNKDGFKIEKILDDSKKICECAGSKLAAILKEESANEIIVYFYNI